MSLHDTLLCDCGMHWCRGSTRRQRLCMRWETLSMLWCSTTAETRYGQTSRPSSSASRRLRRQSTTPSDVSEGQAHQQAPAPNHSLWNKPLGVYNSHDKAFWVPPSPEDAVCLLAVHYPHLLTHTHAHTHAQHTLSPFSPLSSCSLQTGQDWRPLILPAARHDRMLSL